jgi:hypothetical protein
MDRNVFTQSHAETIDIVERGINDLRGLGATIVDPGPGGALFQGCIDKYLPLYRNRAFIEQHRDLFPADANGKPSMDRIPLLVDMFLNPSLVPAGATIRNIAGASDAGMTKYMLTRYLRERGDANIKSVRDLIDKSKFYRDIRPDAGFVDRKAALEEMNSSLTLDTASLLQNRFAYQQVVLQCMAQDSLDALVSPPGNIPAYILGAPIEPLVPGAGATWGLLGQHGFPTLIRPGGFHHSRLRSGPRCRGSWGHPPDRAHSGQASGRYHVLRQAVFRADAVSDRFGLRSSNETPPSAPRLRGGAGTVTRVRSFKHLRYSDFRSN